MTPRIKELNQESDLSWFSEELLSQLKKKNFGHQLNGTGPLFELLHPALIKCRHAFEHSPQELVFRSSSSGWNLQAFKNQQEVEAKTIGIKSYGGYPWQISNFLMDNPQEAVIHFGQLGSVFLSKTDLVQTTPENLELHQHILPVWLDYALSPELWGPAGKWPRFHARLHTLFENNGLFIEQDFPGFYPLKKEAQWLAQNGFQGRLTQTNFDLILTWDFPLSGLIELEKVLARGP
jgi:hypothetical protein